MLKVPKNVEYTSDGIIHIAIDDPNLQTILQKWLVDNQVEVLNVAGNHIDVDGLRDEVMWTLERAFATSQHVGPPKQPILRELENAGFYGTINVFGIIPTMMSGRL